MDIKIKKFQSKLYFYNNIIYLYFVFICLFLLYNLIVAKIYKKYYRFNGFFFHKNA